MKFMHDFIRGFRTLPMGWQWWSRVLLFNNLVMPIFFLNHVESRWVLVAVFIAALMGKMIVKMQGFTKLIGLMHIPWLVLLPYIWTRLEFVPASDLYGLWIRSILIINGISLLIDFSDVLRYIRGNRKSSI